VISWNVKLHSSFSQEDLIDSSRVFLAFSRLPSYARKIVIIVLRPPPRRRPDPPWMTFDPRAKYSPLALPRVEGFLSGSRRCSVGYWARGGRRRTFSERLSSRGNTLLRIPPSPANHPREFRFYGPLAARARPLGPENYAALCSATFKWNP